MIALPGGTRIWLAAGVTDMRRGMHGLAATVQMVLAENLYAELERGKFVWPLATSGTVCLSQAQLSMLLEGINWKRFERTWQPQHTV
jgi:transposase